MLHPKVWYDMVGSKTPLIKAYEKKNVFEMDRTTERVLKQRCHKMLF